MTVTQTAKSRSRRKFPRRTLFFVPVTVAVLAAICGMLAALAGRVPSGHIPPGVRVAGAQIGGLAREDARTALQKLAKQRQVVPLTLHFAPGSGIKRVWKPAAAKLGLGIDITATLDAAEKSGQTGILGQAANVLTGTKSVSVVALPLVDSNKLRAYLKAQIIPAVNRKAKSARIVPLPKGGYKIVPDKSGLTVDIEASMAAITQAWTNYNSTETTVKQNEPNTPDGQTPAPQEGQTPATPQSEPTPDARHPAPDNSLEVELATKITKPAIAAAMLKGLSELGSFSTRFGGTGATRGQNIALATGHINGTLIAPGEIFSYNKIVGPRIESAGFQDAPVIVKGELVPGIGGGICQVSSTLYNAVLLSDLKIVHRAHHAFPVHYLPAGRDATVVDGAIDFKFQNNTPAPIYISASSSKGHLAFRLLGQKKPGKKVTIELANHEIEPTPPARTVPDPTLYAGTRKFKDKGHRGHRVLVYRVVREGGQVTKKELIARDHYKPFAPIVLVGTRPRPAKKSAVPVTPLPGTTPASPTPPTSPAPTPQ